MLNTDANICPFCSEKIRNNSFFFNQNYFVIYNRAPIVAGHSLVIPYKHYEKLNDIPLEESKQLFPFIQQVMKILTQAFKTQSFDISVQDGIEAGQTVLHTHVHIIPRFVNDCLQPSDWYQVLQDHEQKHLLDSAIRPHLPEEKLLEITDKLRNIAKKLT